MGFAQRDKIALSTLHPRAIGQAPGAYEITAANAASDAHTLGPHGTDVAQRDRASETFQSVLMRLT